MNSCEASISTTMYIHFMTDASQMVKLQHTEGVLNNIRI